MPFQLNDNVITVFISEFFFRTSNALTLFIYDQLFLDNNINVLQVISSFIVLQQYSWNQKQQKVW